MWLSEVRSDSKESAQSAGDPGLITGCGRSPGEGNGSSIPAWEVPWTEEPGPWSHEELYTTEQLTFSLFISEVGGAGRGI